MKKIEDFQLQINYQFLNKKLIKDALTHPSFANSDFELLEFIGDRVLSLCIAKILWNSKLSNEKEYARKFMPMTNKNALLAAALRLQLPKYVSWKGEKSHENTIIQDACEAIIGALFLDAGFESALSFVEDTWKRLNLENFTKADPVSILQNWANRKNIKVEFIILEEKGPPHKREYVVELKVENYKSITQVAPSLKEVKKKLASNFLKDYQNEEMY